MILRNPLQPYSPAVLAWTLAMLALAIYAFDRALTTPVRKWGGDDDAR